MSEKVTFQELIDSISEETDHSKQFTHDFLKGFVDVIQQGLKEDAKVNIAGFGKFNLKKVDERAGRNPQTGEEITIPEHNKVGFKPYKVLRERVNAPFAHLEPQLIEPEQDTANEESEVGEDEQESPDAQHNYTDQDVSPAVTEDTEATGQTEDTGETDKEEFVEDPFGGLGEETEGTDEGDAPIDNELDTTPSPSFILEEEELTLNEPKNADEEDDQLSDDDIVEFKPQNKSDEELEAALHEFINSETTPAEESTDGTLDDADGENLPNPSDFTEEVNSPKEKTVTTGSGGRFSLVAAGICILLMMTGGAWYYELIPQQAFFKDNLNQLVSVSEVVTTEPNNAKEENIADKQNNEKQADSNVASSKGTESPFKKITITKGQTLWSIARENYDNARLWPWIYDNNERLDNPDLIKTGNQLAVPLPSEENRLTSGDSIAVAKGYIATYRWYKNNGYSHAKEYLWVATRYHQNIYELSDRPIDKADLAFANQSR